MEIAVRRRLEGVADVSISQSQQTAAVTFLPETRAFSAATFRAAIAEADVEVLSLEMDVCGIVTDGRIHWVSGSVTPIVVIRGVPPSNGFGCVNGRLNDQVEPYELHVIKRVRGSE